MRQIVLSLVLAAATLPALAATEAHIFKSPTCGCCGAYADYLKKQGVAVSTENRNDMDALKRELGVPASLASCHTTRYGKYVIEGHVPVEAIRQLEKTQPDIIGLTLPGMPATAPGMGPAKAGSLKVMTIEKDGSSKLFMTR